MSCRVCQGCELRVPHLLNVCPACGDETRYDETLHPDEDWEYKAAQYVSPARRRIVMWRRKTFVEAGFSGALLDLLVESTVDPHEAADLVRGGCPVDLACQILL